MASSNPLDLLRARGFVADVTDEDGLRKAFDDGRVTFYAGFDPTAPSLHIGNLVGVMAMAHLQRAGHRPIALVGGATGRIGDPSFKDEERQLLDDDVIEANLAGQRKDFAKILDLSSSDKGMLVDNFDWTKDVTVLEFLRDVGKHFSVNAMVAKESVRKRLTEREHGISFTEFSYQLLQAFDFAVLYEREGCILQGGGTDQWGNITAGIDLVRRLHGGTAYGVTWPLIERSDGKKFSKSTGNAIWMDPRMTSPYAWYQWFRNVPDDDVLRFLKLYTFMELDDIAELERVHAADPSKREAHTVLAAEATRIVHGDAGVAEAEQATAVLFGDQPFAGLDDATLDAAFEAAPSIQLDRGRLDEGMGLLDLLREVGAASSNSDARRLVTGGGVHLNNAVVTDPAHVVGAGDLASPTTIVIRVGRKRWFLSRFV